MTQNSEHVIGIIPLVAGDAHEVVNPVCDNMERREPGFKPRPESRREYLPVDQSVLQGAAFGVQEWIAQGAYGIGIDGKPVL